MLIRILLDGDQDVELYFGDQFQIETKSFYFNFKLKHCLLTAAIHASEYLLNLANHYHYIFGNFGVYKIKIYYLSIYLSVLKK